MKQSPHAMNGIVDAAAVLAKMQREHEERHAPAELLAIEGKEEEALATAQEDHEIRQEIRSIFPRLNIEKPECWENIFVDTYRWLTYVHRYACWLLVHEKNTFYSLASGFQKRLFKQLRKDFPNALQHDLRAIIALAHLLANQLIKWLDTLKIDIAWFENITLLPVMWGTQVHWRFSGHLPDHSPVALPDNVLMTLESAGHDWGSWLERRASD